MKSKKILIAIIFLLSAVLVGCGVYLFSYFYSGYQNQAKLDQLSAIREQNAPSATTAAAAATVPGETTAPTEAGERNTVILKQYQSLHDDPEIGNSDIVGWLKIDGTKIDYAVMQTDVDNPDYYLYRDWDKKDNSRGSIYVRETCDVFTPGDNITMYGHNMRDGSMFAGLLKYQDKAVWENNSLITFDTIYEYHTYKIFAVFKTTASIGEGFSYQKFEEASSAAEFDDFISECRKLAFYDTGIIPAYGDKIICLSTCEYTQQNGRFVIAAVQIS